MEAIRKSLTNKKDVDKNQKQTYYFDIEKCKVCPIQDGCYKDGAKINMYSVSIKSTEHEEQGAFQETERFKDFAKKYYKIEAKNSELKNPHGYNRQNWWSIWPGRPRTYNNICGEFESYLKAIK